MPGRDFGTVKVRKTDQAPLPMFATMHDRSRSDYAARLDRVVTWLVEHLDDDLDLNRLAEVACLSPFHFHRVYRGLQGETVADTVRRIRLHRAAGELIAGRLPVERIAVRAGYGSQPAFTRAFRAAYGVPPARYRSAFAHSPTIERSSDMDTTTTYQVTFRENPVIPVAALPHVGSYLEIGRTFERMNVLAQAQGLIGPTTRMYGLYYDDPKAVALSALRSDACVSVPADCRPSGELQRRDIRGGRYAVITHVGPYAELHRAYDWLFAAWLPTSNEEPADAPCVEFYVNDPRTVPPTEWQTEIWLPVR